MRARSYGGLRLGLYITRVIVTALGGTVTVESAPGEGSAFVVELPTTKGERGEQRTFDSTTQCPRRG